MLRKIIFTIMFTLFLCLTSFTVANIANAQTNKAAADSSLIPPPVNTSPGPEYLPQNRLWQGIPGLERTQKGRLFATWYTGGTGEAPGIGRENYVVIVTSDDDGNTWSKPRLVIDPPGSVRANDPVLWHDPLGRLWLFWSQSFDYFDGRAGTWAVVCDNPDAGTLVWSKPGRLANGTMMNKPTVLSNGDWLLPNAVWNLDPEVAEIDSLGRETGRTTNTNVYIKLPEMEKYRHSNVTVSTDKGKTWTHRGGADVPERTYDEHIVTERRDGTLWMLVRTDYGIGQSFSKDRGITWSPGEPSMFPGPNARFCMKRLKDGKLLFVNHQNFWNSNLQKIRINLTAFLSDDDGKTWYGGLLLDGRENVSYPDGVEAADGRIYIIYDRSRYGEKEILMAVFREADVKAGKIVSPDARLRVIVDKAGK